MKKGWHNWSNKEAEITSIYGEYQCNGEGYKPQSRVAWSHQLKKSQAKKYTIEHILKDYSVDSTVQWYANFKTTK